MHREIDEFSEIHVWSHDTPGAMELSEGFLQKYFETLEQGDTVLDIGCGQGTVVEALQQRGYKVLGVDTNREMIEAALAENLSVRQMSAVAAVEQELLNHSVFSMLDFVEHIPLNVLQDLFRVIATRPPQFEHRRPRF